MIKKLTLIIGFTICLSSCGKDYVYRIEGELSNLEDQTVYAVFEKDNYKVVDTVACTKPGQFQIDQHEAGFHGVTIFFADKEHWGTAYLDRLFYCSPCGWMVSEAAIIMTVCAKQGCLCDIPLLWRSLTREK